MTTLRVSDEVREAWDCSTPKKRELSHMDPRPTDVAQKAAFLESAPGGVWLDWGSGGGALLGIADQHGAERVICVDVSQQALDALPRSACEVVKLQPQDVATVASGSVDVLCSFSCFQHFPSNEYGLEVLREMARIAKPGALGFVQTRYCEPGEREALKRDMALPYADRMIWSCAYEVTEFWDALKAVGFAPLGVELESYRNYAWYRMAVTP